MEKGCLDRGQTLIVDLDGVVWIGRKPIEENVIALRSLISRGYRVLFLTNNSTRSRTQYVRMLRDLGIIVGIDSVITSGYLAASWLYEQKGASEVYIVGEEGLIEEAVLAHHRVLTGEEAVRSTAVLVGLDRNLTYQKLRAAARALLNGSLFIATNTDHVIPVEDGLDPGAGAIIAALEATTGRKPDFVAGKPNPWIIDLVEKRLGIPRQNLVIIGDRVDTDMKLAMDTGVRGILVLTGLTGEDVISKAIGLERLSVTGITIMRTLKDLVDRC
ncbi:MAG: HAD-IIA family hydrolase [Sulfolobales archaeon]